MSIKRKYSRKNRALYLDDIQLVYLREELNDLNHDGDSTPCICRTKPPLELFSPELDNICSMCGINWLSEGGCVHLYTGEGDD